jgi:dipeptidyl aminopeptidase/acylaminoacyl peptidase
LSDPRSHQGNIYWHESKPSEQGRGVVVCRDKNDREHDLIPPPYSARSSVHEYGGRCYALGEDQLFFVNSSDQQIYSVPLGSFDGSEPKRLTPQDKRRYADLERVESRNALIAVCEDHRVDGEAVTSIVSIQLDGHFTETEPTPLVSGADFYAYPRVSTDHSAICWLEWNHPQMPWFSSELWTAELQGDRISEPQKRAGNNEAIFQPGWHKDGTLYFCSDQNDLWNLYRINSSGEVEQVSDFEGECGLPLWQFGMQTYAFLDESNALCGVCREGIWQLVSLDLSTGKAQPIPSELSLIHQIASDGTTALVVSAGPTTVNQLDSFRPESGLELIKSSSESYLDISDISVGEAVEFKTSDNMQAKAFYYQPRNSRFNGPAAQKPPLVVLCHGGPTAAAATAINLKVQFWTSRGFAVMDVNYRGSTGYGREYRNLLNAKWGIYDVEDACAAAEFACNQGWADPEKTIIRGSSAGGLTVLNALCFHDTFKAGGCLYGIGDLKILVNATHKFEARYGDQLIAPWPKEPSEYDRRSPIYHVEKLSSPVIFFQGLKDKVVPPEQTELMVNALKEKGVAVAYETYDAEGHGFRSAETIVRSFNAELAFYGELFGFKTDSSVTDLEIANLK